LATGAQSDSIIAFHDTYGVGTYKIEGDKYIETTEFFYLPQYVGTSVEFTFKVEGDLWYTSGHFGHYEDGKKIDDIVLEQKFKRIK